MRIVLTGGGSGGHVFPLVAVASELKKHDAQVELLYIGTPSQMGKVAEEVMAKEGIATKNVLAAKARRYFSLQYFVDAFRLPFGMLQALWHLLVYMPDAVFSKGGYASVPVVLAAWVYRIPVLTHDSDAVPGWANRICGKFSRYVALSYPESATYFGADKTAVTGNPIRTELLQGDAARGLAQWGFTSGRPTIVVMGGSQGARAVNRAILDVLPQVAKVAQVLHITGSLDHEETVRMAGQYGFKSGHGHYVAVPFLDRTQMADAYAMSTMLISRAGANSITEIAAVKKPSILIPLPSAANNHQYMNAFSLAKQGAAVVLEESNLGHNILLQKIDQILHSRTLQNQMAERIAPFYHSDAAAKIVAGIVQMTS